MALIVQSKEGTWGGVFVSGRSTTFDSAPTEGNTICAFLYTEDCALSTLNGTGWTLRQSATSGHGNIFLYTKTAGAGESATISTPTSGGGNAVVHIAEVAGSYDASGEVDDGASNLFVFTGPSVASSGTGAGAVLTAFAPSYQTYNIGSLTADGSLVELYESSIGGRVKAFLGYQEVAALSGSYQHSVTSTVRPSDNEASNTWAAVTVILAELPLTANFSGTPLSGSRPLAVQFTDLTTRSPTSWEWDFGDSNVSTEQNPVHVYANAGTYTVTLIARSATESDSETKTAYVTATVPTSSDPTTGADAEFWIDWDNDGFASGGTSDYELARMLPEGSLADDNVTPYLMAARWQRGGQQDLIGGQAVGTLTATLKNTDGRFSPDNASGPLYGKLEVGRRVWLGALRSTATYKGLWAGYIKEIVPLPRIKQVQVICHDAFGLWQEARVRVPFSTTRTAQTWRSAVLDDLGLGATQRTLAPEPYELAVSGVDATNGLAVLDELNQQTGTRHLILPADDKDDFYRYRTISRNQNLGLDTPPVTLTEDDIVGMAGYRRTWQTVINYQQVTPHQVRFEDEELVWEYADIPFSVSAAASRVIKASFPSWVKNPRVVTNTTAGSTTLVNYGRSAELTMLGVGTVTRLEVWGLPASEPGESVEFAEDVASQVRYEVIREGAPIDASLIRSSAQALALAQGIVVRSAAPRTRPQVSFRNRFDRTLTYDHGDVVMQSLAELDIVSRRYEIVGVSGAVTAGGRVWDFGWTYLETPYQTSLDLFTLNDSVLNGPDILGF